MRSLRQLITLLATASCIGCSALPWEAKPTQPLTQRSTTAELLDLEIERDLARSKLLQTEAKLFRLLQALSRL